MTDTVHQPLGGRWGAQPVLASSQDQQPRGVPGASPDEGPAEAAGQFRILIVEDEWFIALESEAVLRSAGYSVVGVAATAEEAVSLAERENPDLVLMDVRLRGTRDGIDAALEIRRRLGIPSLFATAHNESHVRERGAEAAPRAWLTKPFSDQQLLRAIRTALARLD